MERFDCHCHIFNIMDVGIKAILEHFDGTETYLQRQNSNKQNLNETSLLKDYLHIRSKIKKFAELIRLFKNDSEKIFAMLDKHYKGKYTLFPLMFDGDFLLEKVSDYDDIKNLIEENKNIGLTFKSTLLQKDDAIDDDHAVVLDFLNESLPALDQDTKRLGTQKRGFDRQYDDIVALKQKPNTKDKIVPFLGVDPRRKDIKQYLPEVGKDKLFAGIKVYPPNGFSPMDKVLVGEGSIFEYCSKNQIPIVSHCSYGGFATPSKKIYINGMIVPEGSTKPEDFSGLYTFTSSLNDGFNTMVLERASVLNSPLLWEEVLKIYPDLILVLAHFGSGNDEWQANILRMMKTYANLYTDVSCMSTSDTLKSVKTIFDANQDIQDKILYGSDYFLDMFFNDSFDQYLKRMKKAFGANMFDKLSSANPMLFMDKWYAKSNISKALGEEKVIL